MERTRVAITDLGAEVPLLTVQGRAQGEVGDVLRFVTESPLDTSIGNYLRDARGVGAVALDLDLALPLAPQPERISGVLHFTDSTLSFGGDAIELTRVNGAEPAQETGRLRLCVAAQRTLARSLDLLGVTAPQEM